MRKHLRRLLSMLLVLTMVTSFVVTGWAVDGNGGSALNGSGTELELENLDPGTLHIPKLGEVADGEVTAEQPVAISPTDIVRVSIFLNSPAALDAGYSMEGVGTNRAAVNYRDSLRRQQADVTAAIEKALNSKLDVKWNLTLAANAISAEVRYMDIPTINSISGVRKVVMETRYDAPVIEPDDPNTANTGENMVGAWEAWDAGYTGAGSRIAIIDTGIDTTHQSFAAEPFTYSVGQAGATSELMTQTQVNALKSQLNSGTANYVSAKIPYGYNYVDKNTTINHLNDTKGEHGSHVAGIAAANRYIGTAHNDAASTVGAVGMAPDAQLFIMKVFGAGGGAYDSDYMVAIEDAIVLDCDVVNLSLGSSVQGWTFDEEYQDILNNLANREHNEGMVVSISAGNAYDFAKLTSAQNLYKDDVYYHTGGSPGTFVNSLCVAAAQNTLTKGMPLIFNGDQTVFYAESTEDEDGNAYGNAAMSSIAGTYDYVFIDAAGNASDYSTVNSTVSLSGKIVIVNRGDISFVEKGNNAKSYNPKGVVIANNAEGVIHMALTDFEGTFPMVSITLKDANLIKEASTSGTAGNITYYTGSVQVTNVEQQTIDDRSEATITDFSSWGVPGSLIMKPEITAPGGDIYSVAGTNTTSSGGTAGGSDQYEYMSGTSMAAPHITGLSAVVAEYLRENPISGRNTDLNTNYSTRAIIQSLLMSTATPMQPAGEYLSVLQQGSGLADVSKAVSAGSVIMMTEEGNTLTARTGSIADGKVKAELGDDPDKAGVYSFGFTVYNLTDKALTYELNTDLFTQKISGEFLARGTSALPAGGVTYTWNGEAPVSDESHDVNMDGKTDNDDVQAILDFLAGLLDEESIDMEAADMDGDEMVTSYDAYLLIDWEPAGGTSTEGYTVAAHGSAEVVVNIKLTAAQKEFLANYATGAYLEGFTYVTCVTEGEEHEHTIPILGFYGSWTDPTMFDTRSYVDGLYGSEELNYSGAENTNYLRINAGGSNAIFTGNPYKVEDEFPADRLAISSNTTLVNIAYNLIRSAASTGFAVTKLDDQGNVTSVVNSSVAGNRISGQYYTSTSGWQNTGTKLYSIGKSVSSYNFSEGQRFRVGFYAIPEYNGMVINDSYDTADSGVLNLSGFNTLLTNNVLGKGAFVGYDFTVDNTAPTISNATLNGNTLSVTASDNLNLAYVAVLSLDGTVQYAEATPGTNTYTVSFDASDAIANAQGYVAVFAGDYAGNETAKAVKVNNNSHVEKTVYVLTDSLTAGNDYLISEVNAAGTGHVLSYTAGSWSNTITATAVTVKTGTSDTNNKPYIESADAPSTGIWTASSGIKLMNGSNYLRRNSNTGSTLQVSTTNSYNSWSYDGTNSRLGFSDRATYMRYYNNTFSLSTATNNKIYIYQKTTISYEIDPYAVSGVTVTPAALDLYKGNTADVSAKVLPLTATDRTVTWSSSNTSVATVDANGVVTAVAAGTANIIATSNADSTKTGTCVVTVTSVDKTLYGIVWDEEGGVFFSNFNASSLPTWNKNHTTAKTDQLHSAFMQSTSALYAGTLDGSSLGTTLYTVNRTSYALTEVGENFVGAMDLAIGVTNTTYAGYVGMVYCYGPYLVAGPYASKSVDLNDGSTFTGTGIPYGMLDFSETTGCYACAVAAQGVGTTSSTYYVLDENGAIWTTSLSYSSSDGFTFSTPTKVLETGISTSFTYQTLYYNGTYLFWGHQADNLAELIIIKPSTGSVYHAGDFGEGVWPAVGFYTNGSVAPASLEDEEPMELGELQPLVTRDELMTEEIRTRIAAELAKFAPEEAPAYGGLNAFSGPIQPIDPIDPIADEPDDISEPVIGDGNVTIDLIEKVAAHNGLYTVEYDPDVLAYVKTTSNPAYSAINVDKEKGVITYAFADKDTTFAANATIATVEFATSCEDTVITSITLECNDRFELSDNFEQAVTGVGHVWGAPTWEWAADYSTATASFVCQNNAEHTTEVDATITSEITAATCEVEGTTVYTATVELDGQTYTDTKTVTTAATGHVWGEPEWTWNGTAATAKFTCANDATHTQTVNATVTSETTAASCETDGETVYTATVTFNGQTYTDTSTETIPATGHVWGEPEWTWNGTAATAKFTCANDATHTQTVNATVTSETTAASCETDGETVYTATVTFNGQTYTDTSTETIPATGHTWGEPTYEWAADNSAVTATRVCVNDASHVETETAYTTQETTASTCDEPGEVTYTAVFTNPAFETQAKTVVTEAVGHDWDDPAYVWADDNSTVTATRVCKRDSNHVETETATPSYEVVTEPTTESEGLGRYTATFQNPAFETQTKEVTIDKLPIEGYHIIVTNYTAGNATTSIDAETLYSGEVTFTVSCAAPCVVAVDNGNDAYTVLTCSTSGDEHSFTVTVADADVTIVIAVKGDANLNGAREAKDATFAAQAVAGKRTFTALQQLAMDGNGDGEFDSKDATYAAQVESGKRSYKW